MKSERILELMARKAGKAASREELEELEQLLAEHPDYRFMETVLDTVEAPAPDTAVVEDGWAKVEELLRTPLPVASKRPYWWAAAAVLLATVGAGMWWLVRKKQPAELALQQISAPMGSTIKALLPDGTQVWINAGSQVSYDARFTGGSRDVTVTGEVFFDVAKDDNKPFIVHSDNLAIQVLGTSFNIRAYGDDQKAEVAVITGKVQVMMRNSPEKKVVLLPREKLVLSLDKRTTIKADSIPHVNFRVQELAASKDPDVVMETAWCQQKLAFMNETFAEVARKMERQFNVNIVFEDETLKKEILSGVFEKEDVNKALHLLQMTTGFHYRVVQQQVYLSR
ncbi:FecR family protein [Chitinophaga qingshengii]|uniref:FecR domain-containing protein n=1 Tax=Chitinophaga qingshengii TaxID=1569794 RepID=A0ABR7THD1_9BACT|nr:FecR domain-containing protein [Chitinophaga qingshengii]MBC9929902.1 FecR domain-containing protein [Chitinophaga qingshengii]